MSTRACLTCGRVLDLEEHHVAGWRNDPDLTVGLCVPCHHVVTAFQHAAGVNLEEGPRGQVDVARAALVGAAHLLELFLARHPGFSRVEPDTVRVAGRVVSAGLDLISDPDRPGRRTPDPRLRIPITIRPTCHDPAQAIADWARFVVELERILNAGALDVAARAIGARLRPITATEFAVVVGALAIGFGAASRRAREVASGLGEEDASLVRLAAVTTLRLLARLQDAQKGLV